MESREYITVREVLASKAFASHSVVAGTTGLDNLCKHMVILETPDGMEWLQGNEIVLTAGYAFASDVMKKSELIRHAKAHGAAAIGIKLGRYFGEIDNNLIDEANASSIPVFVLPREAVYTDIICDFYNLLFNRKNKYILEKNQAYYSLLNLQKENRTKELILEEISRLIQCPAKLVNPYKEGIESEEIVNDKIRESKEGVIFYDIKDSESLAYLCIESSKPLDDFQEACIQYGIALLKNLLLLEQSVLGNQSEIHRMITELLLNDDHLSPSFYENVKRNLGWISSDYHAVYVKWVDEKNRGRNVDIRRFLESNLNSKFLYSKDKDAMVLFFNEERTKLHEILLHLLGGLRYEYRLKIGCSSRGQSIKAFRALYEEAKMSCSIPGKPLVYFEDLGTEKLFYHLWKDPNAQRIYQEIVLRLKIYDQNHRSDLLRTLKVLVQENFNKKQTAKELFIHVETLRYRLTKIEDITGYSIQGNQGVLHILLALALERYEEMT